MHRLSICFLQPGVAVDIDLDREGEPSGQADVDLAQLWIDEVEIEHALGSARVDQSRTPLAVDELEARASLHAAEDADQPINDGPLSQDLLDQLLCRAVRNGVGEIGIRLQGLLGQLL